MDSNSVVNQNVNPLKHKLVPNHNLHLQPQPRAAQGAIPRQQHHCPFHAYADLRAAAAGFVQVAALPCGRCEGLQGAVARRPVGHRRRATLAEWAAKWSGLFRLRHGRDAPERFEARPYGPMTATWYR